MKFIKNWKNYKVAKINPFMKDLAKRKLSLIKKIVLRCLKNNSNSSKMYNSNSYSKFSNNYQKIAAEYLIDCTKIVFYSKKRNKFSKR